MFFIYTKGFLNHLRSELHSERTVETYCQSLNAFRIFLYDTYSKTVDQITVDFVTEEIIREFLSKARCINPHLPPIHPHLLRHSYGAQLYRLGVSLPEIAKLLGHEDISTTEIYAETDPEMAAKAISKMLGNQPARKWDFLTEEEKLKILGLK